MNRLELAAHQDGAQLVELRQALAQQALQGLGVGLGEAQLAVLDGEVGEHGLTGRSLARHVAQGLLGRGGREEVELVVGVGHGGLAAHLPRADRHLEADLGGRRREVVDALVRLKARVGADGGQHGGTEARHVLHADVVGRLAGQQRLAQAAHLRAEVVAALPGATVDEQVHALVVHDAVGARGHDEVEAAARALLKRHGQLGVAFEHVELNGLVRLAVGGLVEDLRAHVGVEQVGHVGVGQAHGARHGVVAAGPVARLTHARGLLGVQHAGEHGHGVVGAAREGVMAVHELELLAVGVERLALPGAHCLVEPAHGIGHLARANLEGRLPGARLGGVAGGAAAGLGDDGDLDVGDLLRRPVVREGRAGHVGQRRAHVGVGEDDVADLRGGLALAHLGACAQGGEPAGLVGAHLVEDLVGLRRKRARFAGRSVRRGRLGGRGRGGSLHFGCRRRGGLHVLVAQQEAHAVLAQLVGRAAACAGVRHYLVSRQVDLCACMIRLCAVGDVSFNRETAGVSGLRRGDVACPAACDEPLSARERLTAARIHNH